MFTSTCADVAQKHVVHARKYLAMKDGTKTTLESLLQTLHNKRGIFGWNLDFVRLVQVVKYLFCAALRSLLGL